MATDVERFHVLKVSNREKFYSPDILPQLQTVLSDLADIDFAYEKRLASIKRSGADENRKNEMIASLWHRHREQRAPFIQQLTALQARIEKTFA